MGVAYRKFGEPRKRRLEFLEVADERRVMLLGPPSQHVQVYLHWTGRYSVPCLGDECDLCHTPAILYGYASAVLLRRSAGNQYDESPCILPVTDGALALLETDLRDRHLLVWRVGQKRNGKMMGKIVDQGRTSTVPLFDVRERLESMWATRSRVPTYLRLRIDAEDSDMPEKHRTAFG